MRFQSFRLDPINHCLWRRDERVAMTPKAFDLLRYLVEHAERLVTQQELLEALWPSTHVTPDVVKKYVLELRKVLGDRSDEPIFIRTFPRRGYQFVARIEQDGWPGGGGALVGRAAARAKLEAGLEKALRGGRQTVFVTGEAGIGKTTLVDSFLADAGGRAALLVGHCVEGFGGKEAYYPILEAIGGLVRDRGGLPFVDAMRACAPTWLLQFPALVAPGGREALQRETLGSTRERMVRELCEALEAAAARRPLVLVLEDLHWADVSTLDAISALARRRGAARLLVVGTFRSAGVVAKIKALKEDLRIHDLATEIRLDQLGESDVAAYLAARVPGLPAELAGLVHRHSGGSPLFMAALVDEMVEKGRVVEAEGGWRLNVPLGELAPVPESLQQMLAVQLEELEAGEQRILTTACVVGDRFSSWVLEDADDVCEALAARQQFIRAAGIHELADGTSSAHYEFRHSAYRQFLYARLSEVARARLHRQVGERLQLLGRPEHAAEVAMHFEEAREHRQAIRALVVSSENAAHRFAYREAVLILEHARALVGRLAPELRAEVEVELLQRIGDVHYLAGAMLECSQAHEAGAALAARAGLRAAEIEALSGLVRPYGMIDPDRGIVAIERAVELSGGTGDPALRLLASGARLAYVDWSGPDLEAHVAARARLEPAALPFFHRFIAGIVLSLQGRTEEALAELEAVAAVTDDPTSSISHFFALAGKTVALINAGRFGEVLRIVREGKASAARNGNDPWLFTFREAWLRLVVQDYEGAVQVCDGATDGLADYLRAQPATIGRLAAGYLALERGRPEEALDRFDEILDARTTPKFFLHWYWRRCARLGRCDALLVAGDVARARGQADAFRDSALATADPTLQALAWEAQARVALAERDPAAARAHVERGLAIVARFDVPPVAWRLHAVGARVLGDPDAARARAAAIVRGLAASFAPGEPLAATFLSAPAVRAAL